MTKIKPKCSSCSFAVPPTAGITRFKDYETCFYERHDANPRRLHCNSRCLHFQDAEDRDEAWKRLEEEVADEQPPWNE